MPGPATKSAWPPQSKSGSCRTNHLLQICWLLHYGHCNIWGLGGGRKNRNNLRSNAIRSVRVSWVMDENKEKSFQQIWSFSLFLSYTLEQKKKKERSASVPRVSLRRDKTRAQIVWTSPHNSQPEIWKIYSQNDWDGEKRSCWSPSVLSWPSVFSSVL